MKTTAITTLTFLGAVTSVAHGFAPPMPQASKTSLAATKDNNDWTGAMIGAAAAATIFSFTVASPVSAVDAPVFGTCVRWLFWLRSWQFTNGKTVIYSSSSDF